jgi:sporulation protein YunB
VIIVLLCRILSFADDVIGNSLEQAAEIKMREYVENIVIHSVSKVLDEAGGSSLSGSGIIEPVMNNEGGVAMVTLNTDIINKTGNAIAIEVNDDIHDGKVQKLKISIGTMLGSRILSQITPSVEFDLMPISVSEVSYKTEFESVAINQAKYKVYLVIDTEARIIVPFVEKNIKVENTVLAAETVIVGNVPETFANIPEENISDFVS